MRFVRIGIDVGGTFTDAVAIDDVSRELIGQVKRPTTHDAPDGVAHGITEALLDLMTRCGIDPAEVRFIAHGTTQATNALLEGDVAKVEVIGTGSGLEGARARSQINIEDVELAPGKWLRTRSTYLDGAELQAGLDTAIAQARATGAAVIVAAAPFSVDDPTAELEIMERARESGLPAVGTHELTKLYGLRMRTRTAVVNGSILPRMVETAGLTERCVREAGIAAALMVMRCDGGVMTVDEMRRRPILTVLSGPAAGVAGALLYEKISRGIFLEVGGTSTDLSAIRDGRVMVDYAQIGGHKTYVTSLDVRTVGVAGGSMIRFDRQTGRLSGIGPRSAHIAGLPYAVFSDPSELSGLEVELVAPVPGDPADYVTVRNATGKRFAVTPACAATLLGYAKQGDYAFGNAEAARLAFEPLAAAASTSVKECARAVLQMAADRVGPVVIALLAEYGLEKESAELVGGGGGAAAIVPFLGESLGMKARLARSHEVIAPIGVALAMVREVVERTIVSPQPADLLRVRKEAEEAAIRSGAASEMVTVTVEVDSARNLVRAIATGATDMQMHDTVVTALSDDELLARARADMPAGAETVLVGRAGSWSVYEGNLEERRLLWKRTRRHFRVLGEDGVIRLSREELGVEAGTVAEWEKTLDSAVRNATSYGDGGALLPETFVLCGSRLLDLSGSVTREQMQALAGTELAGFAPTEPILILVHRRT